MKLRESGTALVPSSSVWMAQLWRILLCTTSWSRRLQDARLLVIELAEFPKVLAVAEYVAKDPFVESYLKVKSIGKPELIDFDLTGRGELTRLAFIAGGVDFTGTRHSFDA